MKTKKKKIPVDFDQLSENSKTSLGLPEFYHDETIKCVDCGKTFIFPAETQKQWYEKDKRYLYQRPIRCDMHYETWKKSRKLKLKMDKLLEKLKSSDSINLKFECAEAIIEFYEQTGRGNLSLAKHLSNSLAGHKTKSLRLDQLNERINKLRDQQEKAE